MPRGYYTHPRSQQKEPNYTTGPANQDPYVLLVKQSHAKAFLRSRTQVGSRKDNKRSRQRASESVSVSGKTSAFPSLPRNGQPSGTERRRPDARPEATSLGQIRRLVVARWDHQCCVCTAASSQGARARWSRPCAALARHSRQPGVFLTFGPVQNAGSLK